MATIGIDLGTTYSATAYVDSDGCSYLIPNEDGVLLTPSVIAFSEDEIFVGEMAKKIQQDGSEHVASFFKRSIGDAFFDLEFFGKVYNSIDLSAILLGKLKSDAEKYLGMDVEKAVITVPAYFNNAQREATIEAGKRIGLHVLSILNEPTAASISYGFRSGVANKNVLVYDLGGGTFDITISTMGKNDIRVLSTEGDHNLGGKDFDDCLVTYVCQQFENEFGIDLFEDQGALNSLLVEAERAKCVLSNLRKTAITVVHQQKRGSYEVTQELFKRLSENLLERTWGLTELAISSAGLQIADIHEIILVGGSTRMPMVSEFIENRTNIKPKFHLNADEVVVIGAAIQASILDAQETNQISNFSGGPIKIVEDVMSHSLGMIAINKEYTKYINNIMIGKNNRIPAKSTKTYTLRTSPNRENTLDIFVTQGEMPNPISCDILGKYTVRNIPYTQKQPTELNLTFGYDANGVVQIEAFTKSCNKPLEIRVEKSYGDLSWLTKTPKKTKVMQDVNVTLVIDTSFSMKGIGIEESIKAAQNFIHLLGNKGVSIGLVGFADIVKVLQEPTEQYGNLISLVSDLKNYVEAGIIGYANRSRPLYFFENHLKHSTKKNILLILTDGLWKEANLEIKSAKKLQEMDIDIIAVGFGSANHLFLTQIASSDENALLTSASELVECFTSIAQVVVDQCRISN